MTRIPGWDFSTDTMTEMKLRLARSEYRQLRTMLVIWLFALGFVTAVLVIVITRG